MDTIVAISKVPAQPDTLEIVYSKSFASGAVINHEEVLEDALFTIDVGTYILWVWIDSICHGCQMPAGFDTALIGLYTVYQKDDNDLEYMWGVPDGGSPAPTKIVTWPPK